MAYRNGEVPFSVLIHLGANFWLPPGTAARWLWMVAEGKRRWGVTLRITPDRDGLGGWNGFRPKSAQVLYKKYYGPKAAAVGFSTHGGNVGGREVFAIDVDNWAELGWDKFSALCREAGFTVNFVTPKELWHIGDYNNPWVVPAFIAGSTSTAPTTVAPQPQEEENMIVIEIDTGAFGKHLCILGNGVFGHILPGDAPASIADITGQDRTYPFMINHLPNLLRLWGCDPSIWDIRGGRFVVLDPLKSGAEQVAAGNVWTATKALRATVAGLSQPKVDPAPLVKAIQDALKNGKELTAEEIAKAVNDDAAKRLAG